MPGASDMRRQRHARLPAARDPWLLAAGAVLLMSAPVLPGPSRLAVLPALLLAPGHALLRLLGQAAGWRSVSVAVPVSLVLVICTALVMDVSGVRLDATSLGSVLGAVTALCLAIPFARQLAAGPGRPGGRTAPGGGRVPAPRDGAVGE